MITSYAIVLFDAFGSFPLPDSMKHRKGYLESPFWLSLPRASIVAVVVFQGFAAVGYLMWFFSMLYERPTRGLLQDSRWLMVSNILFLVPSILWPFPAYRLLHDLSMANAILSSACLWIAALGVILMVGGTFEDERKSPVATIGILLLSTVVIVADGIGWSATAIYAALYGFER